MDRGEFNLIEAKINKIKEQYDLKRMEHAFYYFVLKNFFDMGEEFDEIITDTDYLQTQKLKAGDDLGIDMVLIEDEEKNVPIVNLFNFKYHSTFENSKRNFKGNEIAKIESFINKVKEQDESILIGINPNLKSKIREIWSLFNKGKSPNFKIFLTHNGYEKLEKTAEKRFVNYLDNKNVILDYLDINDFIEFYLDKKANINAKLLIEKKDFFEKRNDGNISALILCLNVLDILRILSVNAKEREDVLSSLNNLKIDERVFDENVRVFKKIKGKIEGISDENDINRNIEQTALDPNKNSLFFYYNNGITIICDDYKYDPSNNKIIIKIKNLQIVNGQQTVFSLLSSFNQKKDMVSNVYILCKIYKTTNKKNKVEIAEFTNSQNPVNRRDIRSVDRTQKRFEEELKEKGFFYERKKNQFEDADKNKRLDSLLIGQLLFSFFNKSPTIAKNNRSVIFGKEYQEIFNENINADKIIFVWNLYKFIENKKKTKIRELKKLIPFEDSKNEEKYLFESYVKYCSLFYLFIIKELMELNKHEILSNKEKEKYYKKADEIIRKMIDKKSNFKPIWINYGPFFKNPESIKIFEQIFNK